MTVNKTLFALALGAAAAMTMSVSEPAFAYAYPIITKTNTGRIQGFTKQVLGSGRRVEVFLGVPYAAPPVGDLRFAPPRPHAEWKGLRDGSIMPPACRQASGGSEDCLYLNLYRPAGKETTDKMPVLVYVHGGANVRGAASGVDGARLASYSDAVVVTVQHRLGAFGFLNTPQMKSNEAGNLAIFDLKQALRWLLRGDQHLPAARGFSGARTLPRRHSAVRRLPARCGHARGEPRQVGRVHQGGRLRIRARPDEVPAQPAR